MIGKHISQSQRLRAAIFRIWKQSKERSQGMDSESFYQYRLNQIITEELKKLEPPVCDQ